VNDFRLALRQLARTPGFTLVAVLTLALCIGANSAIFSVINAILLKPYPWPDSGRLVYANNTYPLMGLMDAGVSVPDYLDRRSAVTGFADSALYTSASLNMSGDAQPEMIAGISATPSLFTTLGAAAALGRVFTEDDAKPGSPATIVLSYGLWKSHFGADPAAVGRTIRINGRPVMVIGVMPQGFYFTSPKVQAWTPFVITPAQREDSERGNEYSTMIARLKPGATIAGVQRELDQIQARLAERIPQGREFWKTSGFDGRAVGFLEKNVRDVSSMLWLVQTGVAAALLIGCANVAGLLLARAVGREKELAVRTALGASRLRIIRMLLSESVVLFAAGGLLGLVVAVWSIDALQALGLSTLPRGFGVRLDPTVFAFTLGCAVASGLAFGALPALSASRDNPSASLKESGARGTAGTRTQRLRSALVVAEVALAVMLVATASLLVKSFLRLQQVDPGFVPGGTIAARVALPVGKYDTPEKLVAFHDGVMERLIAAPGVASAGATDVLPFTGGGNSGSYSSPDIVLPPDAPLPHALLRSADPGLLRALGLTLLRGRWFDGSDSATGRRVAVIDRVLVDRYWKGQDPIGKRIVRGDAVGDPAHASTWTVVGEVATVKTRALDESSDKETIYFPMAQRPQPYQVFTVRTTGDPAMLAAPIREAVRSVDPSQPVYDVMTMAQRMDDAAQPRRAPAILLSVFGALAMILAMLGVYGVLAFSVAQRTPEFGVRMALGATPADIAALVLKTGSLLVLAGVAIGLGGYLALNRLVAALLFSTPSMDPAMLMAAPLLLALVALAACLLPAMRATRIEPVNALRHD
jgi:putative ABC transport system permease protein